MTLTAGKIDEHVGQRMRLRRESLGVSQALLGSHLGVSFSQVQKYENGTNRISAGRLYLVAGFLEVPVYYFFKGLKENSTKRKGNDRLGVPDDEILVLNDAFRAIVDNEKRRLLVALVCELAVSAD